MFSYAFPCLLRACGTTRQRKRAWPYEHIHVFEVTQKTCLNLLRVCFLNVFVFIRIMGLVFLAVFSLLVPRSFPFFCSLPFVFVICFYMFLHVFPPTVSPTLPQIPPQNSPKRPPKTPKHFPKTLPNG